MGQFSLAKLFGMTVRESANDGSDFTNPDADYRRLFLGEDGQLHVKDSAGTVTAIGGSGGVATDPIWAAAGDLVQATGNDAAAVLSAGSSGKVLTAHGAAAALTWETPSAAAAGPGQAYGYPTTFTGDTIDGSSTTPFVDVAAFTVKEVLNSRVLHLQTANNTDQRVRVTLGTTKAAAFDVRTAVLFSSIFNTGVGDAYLEVRGSTSADAQLFIARILPTRLGGSVTAGTTGSVVTPIPYFNTLRVGGSSIESTDANFEPKTALGLALTLRFVRDGSNVISFQYGVGTLPLGLASIIDTSTYGVPFTSTVSGTLARIEYAIHTPNVGAGYVADAFVDYVQSV